MKSSAAAAYRRLAESSEHGGVDFDFASHPSASATDGDLELSVPTAGNFSIEDGDYDEQDDDGAGAGAGRQNFDVRSGAGEGLSPMRMSTAARAQTGTRNKQAQRVFIICCTLFSCTIVTVLVVALAYLLMSSGESFITYYPLSLYLNLTCLWQIIINI